MTAKPSPIEIHDRLTDVLSRWSGLPPSKTGYHATCIQALYTFPLENPSRIVEQLEKISKAAADIERAVSAMSQPDQVWLSQGMIESKHAPPDRPDILRHEEENVDRILSFSRELQDGANWFRLKIKGRLKAHPDSKNENRRNIVVAIQVAEIYASVAKREPPKAGADGPFQRLLREVYEALGMPDVDLKGPLLKAYEYRKNRHSWD